jgi:glycosyltransferase involved in cell wall biosynthesis
MAAAGMTGPLRVTQIVFDLEGGGMESLVAEMVTRFAGTSITMSVVTLSGRVGRTGARVRGLADQYHTVRPLPGLSMVAPLGLARAIARTRPDVVHLHSGAWYKSALAARLARVPRLVFTEHGRAHYDPALLQWLDRRASRWTDAVVAVSERVARYLRDTVGVEGSRIRTIPNGVDVERFTPGPPPAALRASLGLPAGGRVIGSIGRLESVKAYERLVEAYARLRAGSRESPLHLVLCGDGSQRAVLERQAAALNVADGVRFPGWTDRPADFYRLFDVFALTSLSEGASVSLLEAMACAAAPVVTDVGANAELLGPELAGQVISGWDGGAFASVLDATLREPGRRSGVGARARRRVVERYSLEGMIAAYERAYRGTL